MRQYLQSNNGLSVVLFNKHYTVAPTVRNYADIVDAVRTDWFSDQTILNMIDETRRKVENSLKLSVSLTYKGGMVYHNGQKLRGYAVSKLIALIEAGQDVQALANFLTKVQANPDQAVIDNLYEFLEHGKMPITPSGDFLAYKAIRADWRDIHSGSVSNVLGSYISMPRRAVDADRNRTCSNGYHVCSFDYLPHFANSNGHVVMCQVNPADVVAIPTDYNNTKMRVSAYRVIDEVTGYYGAGTNILASKEIWDEEYSVHGKDEHEDWKLLGETDDFELAVTEAEQELGFYDEVKVLNAAGTMVFYKKA